MAPSDHTREDQKGKMQLEKTWSTVPLLKSPIVEVNEDESQDSQTWFRRFQHSTNIELFYDLFFVANLTAFTSVHEVNDAQSLQDYVGFFCILWFTWYQVSLYEVRFGMDSVVERVGKAVQFLVMIVIAVCGPQYTSAPNADSFQYYQGLTIGLMISRLVLVVEYLQVCWFARSHHSSILIPMRITVVTYFCSAMIFLGLFWARKPWIGWYTLSALEAVAIIIITLFYRSTGFIGTHFVERMSLLTLIILGEGAIELTRAVQTISTTEIFSFAGSVSAMIVCAVLNIYFLYLIYFDWLRDDIFGNIRMQLWAFTHFPLHVAIALSLTGAAQCVLWNAGVNRSNQLISQVYTLGELFTGNTTSEMWKEAAISFNETANSILGSQLASSQSYNETVQTLADWQQKDLSVIPAIQNGSSDPTAAQNAIEWMTGALYHSIFTTAGFDPPDATNITQSVLDDLVQPINFNEDNSVFYNEAMRQILLAWKVFSLTYSYFTIATGASIGIITILAVLNHGRKAWSIVLRFTYIRVLAIGLGLLSLILLNDDYLEAYVTSPWVIPTVTLALFSIVVVDSINFRHNPQGEAGEVEEVKA